MKPFLDCDGVLADFDRGVAEALGMYPDEYRALHGEPAMWDALRRVPNFYADLPLMPDAAELVDGVRVLTGTHGRPTILTGVPMGGWAAPQKTRWRDRHFPSLPMITTASRLKATYAEPGDILIDDRPKYKDLWEAKGGHFIVHRSARESLTKLAGILAKGGPNVRRSI
jgi:hypothetical protein